MQDRIQLAQPSRQQDAVLAGRIPRARCNSGPLLLVIEDERSMRRFLWPTLHAEGYRLIEAETAAEGIMQAEARNPDLILLDLGLPDGDGVDVTHKLRTWTAAPIIVLSARDREADKVEVLDAGADDYLIKPFGVAELLARLRVALRRTSRSFEAGGEALYFGDIRLNLARREVHRGDQLIRLTPCEYKLFTVLARSAGKVVTHRQLLKDVWGPAYTSHTHYLRVYMAQLRQKLEADPARPRWLVTEAGVGYRLYDEPHELTGS